MAVRKPKTLNAEQLWEYALRILATRAYSEGELRQKLTMRAEEAADIPVVMSKLREYGLADDRKFSETFASGRLQNQGFGRMRVLRDLRAKRVSGTVADQAVSRAFAGVDEQELAAAFLERRYRGKNLPAFLAEERNLTSAYRRLRTAGFSSSSSLSVLKRYTKAVEMDEVFNEEEE
jgi:regulatory protein